MRIGRIHVGVGVGGDNGLAGILFHVRMLFADVSEAIIFGGKAQFTDVAHIRLPAATVIQRSKVMS